MTTSASTAKFEINVQVVNEGGASVELRFDPQGGYVPGLGPIGVWYALAWSPDFPEFGSLTAPVELSSNHDRKKVERGMRQWLTARPFSPAEIAQRKADLA